MKAVFRFLIATAMLSSGMMAHASATRTLDGTAITAGSPSNVLTLPQTTDTLVGRATTDTLTNKTLTSPTINAGALSGTFTGAPTFSGAVVLSGGPTISGSGKITSAMSLVDSTDNTKQLIFNVSALGTASSETLVFNGGINSTLNFPSVSSDTVATLGATQTLGAGTTFHGVAITPQYGGTGLTTITTNGILFGNGTATAGVTSAGSQYQVFQAGASGVPTVGAVNLNQAAAVSGALGAANGGTGLSTLTSGSVLVGNGTGTVNLVAPGTSGNVLTSNGSTWTSAAAASTAPSLNGGSGAAESVTAAGGVTLSSIAYSNLVWVISNGAGNTTVTKTPSVTAGTADGQKLNIIGTDATKTVTLQDQANLASSGLSLNGNWVGGKDSSLNLHWDATQTLWVEDSRR